MKEISLKYLLQLAWKKLYILIGVMVISAVVTFGICKLFIRPQYTASGSVLLTNGGSIKENSQSNINSINNSDIVASINIMGTYVDFMKEPKIYKRLSNSLKDNYNFDFTSYELKKKFSIEQRDERSLFIDIKFTANNPDEAVKIVNEYLTLVPDYFAGTFPYSTVDITSQAEKAPKTYPQTAKNMILMSFLSVVVCYVILIIRDSYDQVISGEEDFINSYKLPVLGSVPFFENSPSNFIDTNGGAH